MITNKEQIKAQTIKSLIDENISKYNYFGIRAMTPNPLNDESEFAEVGSQLNDSYNWIDGETTEDSINGVCALGIDFDAEVEAIKEVIDAIEIYTWNIKQIVLLGSLNQEYGNDDGEVILSKEDTVIAVWEV